jgi:hypothetical protein
MFDKVLVKTEELDGDLAPLEFNPEDREALGVPDMMSSNPVEMDADPVEEHFQTSELKVRSMIKTLMFSGYVWHGEGHEHWLDNDAVLDEIVPGMTRFVNQYPLLAKAVEDGDTNAAPVKLLIVVVKHQIKSIRIKKQQAKAANPAAPVAAQGGAGLYDGLPTA